ncbi:hypothetical protein GCM10023214_68610 [Amycolatopsis dongchuanensis]|uniref:Uncharacterized protein n=1 Tax=Amycolatopsis dongchuanensis TaxID=1070866 RepID=A0ABP8VKN1_9PSEU
MGQPLGGVGIRGSPCAGRPDGLNGPVTVITCAVVADGLPILPRPRKPREPGTG